MRAPAGWKPALPGSRRLRKVDGPNLSFARNQEADEDNRLQIEVVGGGPAGLWFAFLLKRRRPAWTVRVHEQNPATATYGFGVVLSDAGRERVRSAAPTAFDRIARRMERWADLTIVHGGERGSRSTGTASRPSGGSSCSTPCTISAGKPVSCSASSPRSLRPPRSRSFARARTSWSARTGSTRACVPPSKRSSCPAPRCLGNRYAWYGTRQVFPTLTLTFRANADGAFVAHHYRYAPDDEHLHRRVRCGDLGPKRPRPPRRRGGPALLRDGLRARPRRPSARLEPLRVAALPVCSACERWRHENVVLIGDALRSVHFSIGSGTRLAMEDADALAAALDESGRRAADGLERFEAARRPVVDKLLAGAAGSWSWYERFAGRMHLAPARVRLRLHDPKRPGERRAPARHRPPVHAPARRRPRGDRHRLPVAPGVPHPRCPAGLCRVTRPMSGRGDRPVAPVAGWMHAPPGLCGYASDQPDLWIPKRIYPTWDE